MGDYWQATCEILQNPEDPIVEKPKLQEKYLVKPPFRYCHDIISAVQKKTGFAPGLYSGDELDARAIQDKDAKVAYLQKIISVVGMVLGQPVPAKPQKIVAGLEPENTNLFFQMLGRACLMDNGAQAVQQVLGDGAPAQAPPARPASRPSSQQQAERAPPAAEAAPPEDTRSKEKKREHRSKGHGGKERPSSASRHRSSSKAEPQPSPAVEVQPPPPSSGPPARPSSARKGHSKSAAPPPPSTAAPPPAPPPEAAPPPHPPVSTPPGGSRAQSGSGPPQRRGSSMGEPLAARPVAVMAEGDDKDNSDDEVEVVHEAVPAKRAPGHTGEQGVLVRDIKEAEENLRKAGADAAHAAGAEEEAKGQGIILKRMGNKAGGGVTHVKDFGVIQEMVQKLCQRSHPLAKSMDYLQEDLENMGKEFRFWQTERRIFADKLADEERLAGDTKGGENTGADLDNQIRQVRERTLGLKAQVMRNDETVAKLLQMAVSGTGR